MLNKSVIGLRIPDEYLVLGRQVAVYLDDTLLPRLISGELRVADAERFLAEAGV